MSPATQQQCSRRHLLPSLPQPHSSRSSSGSNRASHSSSRVSKQYDAASRGTVFCLTSPTSFLSLPTHPKPSSPSLLQPFLVLQLALPPVASPSTSSSFSLHLALLSSSHLTHSLVLSSAVPSLTLHPFGADLPLSLPSGAWLNVCIPVRDLLWDVLQVEYGGVESVVLKGQCKVRRVFGMRHAVDTNGGAEAEDGDEYVDEEIRRRYERRERVPVEHDFEASVLHTTLLYSQHIHPHSRRREGQNRQRRQSNEKSREERGDEGRQRAPRASRATMPHSRSGAPVIEVAPVPAPPQWEKSIETTDEFASAAHVQRTAASKSTTRSKRSTQPLPSRPPAAQHTDSEKRPVFHVPTSYQMVPYSEPSNRTTTTSNDERMPSSSPSVSRQLHRERRNERRRTADDKADSQQLQHQSEREQQTDASAGLVFHSVVSRSAAATPLSSSSSALPVRPPAQLTHAATSELRPRSPLQVRRPPVLVRTYTAPETIDVQHNVVGRQRRDTRGEERREDEEEEDGIAEVAMERAGTAEVYRTSPVVREHERRLEQRQHRRSRRRREERRGRDEEDEQPQQPQQPSQSLGTATSTAPYRARHSVAAAQPSFAFRPDLSSAESTPNSASATSSHATSRRASLSSSSTSGLPLSPSDMSSNTASLFSTPFTSLPSSPTVRSARPSLIAHAGTSHHSAPSSRRQSVQAASKERDSGRQRLDEEDDDDECNRKDEETSQRRQSATSRPTAATLPRVVEMEHGRPSTSSPRTAATISPALTSALPPHTLLALPYAPIAALAVSDEPVAAEQRPAIASLFSSPSAAVSWPTVSSGPASPPPFSILRSTLPPFSFISKLTESANSTPAAPSSVSSASLPVSSATSPSTVSRPLSSLSQPVSPSPAASSDWARMTVSEDVRKGRDKTTSGTGSVGGDRGQERVLEEIEEEEVMDDEEEVDEQQAAEEDELEAAEEEDTTRDDSGMLHSEPVTDSVDASLHSDRSHHSNSSASEQSRNSHSAARVMAVSQHLRRLSMQESSYDEREDEQQRRDTVSGDEEERKHEEAEEEVEQSEQDDGAADIPHFIHQLPASSTDTSFGSASFAAPVRSTPLLSVPSTSLVPMSSTSPERSTHTASSTTMSSTVSSAPLQPPLPPPLSAPVPSQPPLPTTTTSPSARTRPVSTGDLLVRYDPVLRAYFCPDNGCWYELKADVE